ncbi:ethanolamine-phosphate cytidylyltransferase [Geosmithia morbida]|uniref:ethanolamine-phosphate cytidylyltransferase n=1 Tax=Geosmithia morbida TaxID=1094350 RepID=A0A9P4YQX8_9HYPO|nr:ethanolamine-phosphate cytidylyltransferase [Geosmithia morbida]KAF4120058.1 ethanolamine-phosphate cytidylyltransferase [Geosmithia morbida]
MASDSAAATVAQGQTPYYPELHGSPAPDLLEGRVWVDGCFDFFHHGHAGAVVQARQLGDELYAGVHTDEDILANKGPTVMTLAERLAAAEACRWVTRTVSHAPYVTDLDYITAFGCKYVVHGDDITSDSDGNDCYRFVKAAGRFKVVKRSPGISTTDLVGRMLLCTKTHFIRSLQNTVEGEEGPGDEEERRAQAAAMLERMKLYATDETAKAPGADVWFWSEANATSFTKSIEGKGLRPGQRVAYVDGGFDLFSSGHIEFLRQVVLREEELARQSGWYNSSAVAERKAANSGKDYPPAYVIVGVHEDGVINQWKGVNYPIMNSFERGFGVVFGAPFSPNKIYLESLPTGGTPSVVYHGPTSFMPLTYDPYTDAKTMGIYSEIGEHAFADVNAGQIVQRILNSRDRYEARQRKKGVKAGLEQASRQREILEEEQRKREAQRAG